MQRAMMGPLQVSLLQTSDAAAQAKKYRCCCLVATPIKQAIDVAAWLLPQLPGNHVPAPGF
eukprot:scaffold141184_cov19-Tisochrysis_lutea.AAC.5